MKKTESWLGLGNGTNNCFRRYDGLRLMKPDDLVELGLKAKSKA